MNRILQRVVGTFRQRVLGEPSCEEVNRFLAEYLENTLPAETATRYEKHLENCVCCGDYFEQYRKTVELASACKEIELPPDLVEHTLSFLRERRAG